MGEGAGHFKRTLGFWDSVAINIAIVIGVGIFRVPSEVARHLVSPELVMLAWAVGAAIALAGALCYAELSSSFPVTGGNYIYIKESYSPMAGFLFGWVELLVIRTGSIAAVAFIFSEYLLSFFALPLGLVKPVAVAAVVIISFVNVGGLRYGKSIQNLTNIIKVLMLVGLVVIGVFSGKGDVAHFRPLAQGFGGGGFLAAFGLALIPIMWTYGGWHENTFVAEETKDARRTLPLALIGGVVIVAAIYLAVNALYIYLIAPSQIADVTLIASQAIQMLTGPAGRRLFEVLIIIASLGCLDAMIITGSRVTYAMAKDNAFFRYLGEIDGRTGTPRRAIMIGAVWASLLIVLGTFNRLLFFTGALVWLFFALAVGGIFILRRRYPAIERPYKVWGYPATPAIFILVCAGLFINTVIHYPVQTAVGLVLAMTGIPIYVMSRRHTAHTGGKRG